MWHGRLIALALCAFVAGGLAARAQGLTPAECEEVRVTYGIIPQGCAVSAERRPDPAHLESHVFFRGGGAGLDAEAVAQIDRLARVLKTGLLSDACLRLVGHSDASGTRDDNRALSERRAKVVADALSAGLGTPARVEQIVGMGEDAPLAGLPPGSVWQRRVAIEARRCPVGVTAGGNQGVSVPGDGGALTGSGLSLKAPVRAVAAQ